MAVYYGKKASLDASLKLFYPSDIIFEFGDLSDNNVKIKFGPRSGSSLYSALPYVEGDVPDTSCLGSAKTDGVSDMPANPNKGNWIVIQDCASSFPGQAGIALYNGTTWDITPIPVGQLNFPEPSDDGKYYFRKRDQSNSSGSWEVFENVDGNTINVQIKSVSSVSAPNYIPKDRELVYDPDRDIIVKGDGTSKLVTLRSFYEATIDNTAVINALGYTPENVANKSQPNGYAPLGSDGLVPAGFLPASSTNSYSRTEVDNLLNTLEGTLTTKVNNEATVARSAENILSTDLTNHVTQSAIHVTQTEKDIWNAKLDPSDLTQYDNHLTDDIIHVTQADKTRWDAMNQAYFVTDKNDLPSDSSANRIGNLGYVQKGTTSDGKIICDTYMWNGTAWVNYSTDSTALAFTWGNISGRPSSSVYMIDTAVAVQHDHANKLVLDKIGQTDSGNFTFDGIEIGVRVKFYDTEHDMPVQGEEDVLYIIYEDSRVRRFPSISVWRDGAFQILGRGVQDTAQSVGDFVVLQSEYFGVAVNSSYIINVASNDQFAFMKLEVLKEIPGLKNQKKVITNFTVPSDYTYNQWLLKIDSTNRLAVSLADLPGMFDGAVEGITSAYDSYHVDVDLSDYSDISYIG